MTKPTESSGIELFTRFADKYNDKIEDSRVAETFFDDFLRKTKGGINVDCLDAYNDDRIESVDFDHDEGMIRLCTRIPEEDPVLREMRQMALPFDIYSILIRFKNVHFIRIKDEMCIAIVVNGYTMNKTMIKSFAQKGDYTIKGYDEKSSFFSSNFIREQNGIYEYVRAMKTPIASFWIIPKELTISALESERLLYRYNIEALDQRLTDCMQKLKSQIKLTSDKEAVDDFIKMYGNQIRSVTEAVFKLATCFYHEKYDFKEKDKEYNNRLLGDLITSLKNHVYKSDEDKSRFNTISRIANELSHDSGLPVKITALGELYMHLKYYISDLRNRISSLDNKIRPKATTKPSPRDFIDQNIKEWNFSDIITNTVKAAPNSGNFYRLQLNPKFIELTSGFDKADYLCRNGYIRTLDRCDISEALEVGDRECVIALVKAIDNKVKTRCATQGFDEEQAHLSWDFDIIRRKRPTHLFTLEEIKKLMTDADDSKDNQLVIDTEGYAHISTVPGMGRLYPVSIEPWGAGNGYVGKDSSVKDAEPAYRLCLSLWLEYLKTNIRRYSDVYIGIDVGTTIARIKKHY